MSNSKVVEKILAAALSVGLMTSGVTLALSVSAQPAWANNGNGKGNGNGGGNGRGNSSSRSENSNSSNGNGSSRSSSASNSRGNSANASNARSNGNASNGNNGRGAAIARELGSVNASHASHAALANATPGSTSGKLRAYRDTFKGLMSAVNQQNAAYAEYLRIAEMTESQIARNFPGGGHAAALANATAAYTALRNNAATAQSQNQASLQQLTGGRSLSNAAMQDLHVMLGL